MVIFKLSHLFPEFFFVDKVFKYYTCFIIFAFSRTKITCTMDCLSCSLHQLPCLNLFTFLFISFCSQRYFHVIFQDSHYIFSQMYFILTPYNLTFLKLLFLFLPFLSWVYMSFHFTDSYVFFHLHYKLWIIYSITFSNL